ncbi:MAG: protein-disulfide reductase DsbD domain-containing protein [Chitinophagaceae bacterium]
MKKTIKSLLVFNFLVFSFSFLNAQPKDPVVWTYEAKKKDDKTYDLVITATLPKPWHIYSQNSGADGPIPTAITFNANPLIIKDGKVKETGKLIKAYDENFKTNVLSYADKVVFTQTIKLKTKAKTSVTGTVDYMVCNDEKCLPPTKKTFTIKL